MCALATCACAGMPHHLLDAGRQMIFKRIYSIMEIVQTPFKSTIGKAGEETCVRRCWHA